MVKLTIRRRSLSDNVVFFSSSYFEGHTHMPISSCLKRGVTSKGLSVSGTSLRPIKRLTKSSSLKCFEQTSEWTEGSHFSRFRRTKSTQAFLRFFASGRVSFACGILCKEIPSRKLTVLEQPKTTHLCGILTS